LAAVGLQILLCNWEPKRPWPHHHALRPGSFVRPRTPMPHGTQETHRVLSSALASLLGALPPLGAALGLYWALQDSYRSASPRLSRSSTAVKSLRRWPRHCAPSIGSRMFAARTKPCSRTGGDCNTQAHPETLTQLRRSARKHTLRFSNFRKKHEPERCIYRNRGFAASPLLLVLPVQARGSGRTDEVTVEGFHPFVICVFCFFLSLTALSRRSLSRQAVRIWV